MSYTNAWAYVDLRYYHIDIPEMGPMMHTYSLVAFQIGSPAIQLYNIVNHATKIHRFVYFYLPSFFPVFVHSLLPIHSLTTVYLGSHWLQFALVYEHFSWDSRLACKLKGKKQNGKKKKTKFKRLVSLLELYPFVDL